MTEWVNQDIEKNPHIPTKNKWTGLVLDPLTSIYDKTMRNIEEEYEKYSGAFSTIEGFKYEIDNTPIYAQPDPDQEPEPEPVADEKEEEPSSISDEEKSKLMEMIYDIIVKILTTLATLFVAYNIYYNVKNTGKQIDVHNTIEFTSFGPFYLLTGALLKSVKFFEDGMLVTIPTYLKFFLNQSRIFSDRTLFIIMFGVASYMVNYLKNEYVRLYNFLFKKDITKKSIYNFLFKAEGNKAVYGFLKSVFVYYFVFNNFSIWDPEAGFTYNTGMVFFKALGFIIWLILIIVCFSSIFKPMVSFANFIFMFIVLFYSGFCIAYDIKSLNPKTIINTIRSINFNMNINNVIFDSQTGNEYEQIFESGYKGLFKFVPYGIMIYAFAQVIPDILNIGVENAKWTMLGLVIASIIGIGVRGIREYLIVNQIIDDVKRAINQQITDFQNIDWDGISADQAKLLQHLNTASEHNVIR
jgi:hypothetical protein